MTDSNKEFDYSKLLNLLDEERIKDIGKELASQALGNVPIEYKEYDVKLTVPATVIHLLEILTEIFPIGMDTVLSKMASQGLSNILKEATQPPESNKKINILDDDGPINKMTDQLTDLQTVLESFSGIQKIFGDLNNGANTNSTKQDGKDP